MESEILWLQKFTGGEGVGWGWRVGMLAELETSQSIR